MLYNVEKCDVFIEGVLSMAQCKRGVSDIWMAQCQRGVTDPWMVHSSGAPNKPNREISALKKGLAGWLNLQNREFILCMCV